MWLQGDKSLTKKLLIFTVALILSLSVKAQVAGDYQTAAGGNWNTIATWQRYNGSDWVAATDFPGQNPGAGTVTIRNNHNVTLNVTPANSIGSLVIATGTSATRLSFSGINSITVTGNVVVSSNTTNAAKYIAVAGGTLTCNSISINSIGENNRIDAYVSVTTGTINVSADITMSASNRRTYLLFSGNGTINVGGTISGGGITSTSGGSAAAPTAGTVNYNNSGDQNVGAYTYYNLTLSGGVKSLVSNTQVNNIFNLNSSILNIANYNLTINSNSAAAIQGGPFNSGCMITTNGTGYIQKAVAGATTYTIPIGSNGVYAPVTASNITGSTYLRFRTVYSAALGSQYLKRYWQVTGSGATTATLTFQYDQVENPVDPTIIWVRPTAGAWATPNGSQTFNDIAKTFTITGTNNISSVTSEWTAGYPP